ncbi:hypothetical protein ASZ90_016639 [hydrocarbon metagenome]|uniref:Uncharacterized protein n=1 Tax=hydrocarbon metagenome TaxID=938273 RepID=A0A0W8EKE2_9ZZZZ
MVRYLQFRQPAGILLREAGFIDRTGCNIAVFTREVRKRRIPAIPGFLPRLSDISPLPWQLCIRGGWLPPLLPPDRLDYQ